MSESTVVRRGVKALAAFAIVSAFVSGPFAATASADPGYDTGLESAGGISTNGYIDNQE